MSRINTLLKRGLIGGVILVQTIAFPAAAYAETEPTPPSQAVGEPDTSVSQASDPPTTSGETPSSTESTPPSTTPEGPAPSSDNQPAATVQGPAATPGGASGPSSPPGPDGGTYHLNPITGMWENDLYIWNPITHQTQPKTPQDYSYNPATGMWDTTQWIFDAPSGHYVPNKVSAPANPVSALGINQPNAAISGTGPLSNNTVNLNNTTNGNFDLFYNATISNNINSSATSGNASVIQNTLAGNAISGPAQTVANVLNLIQSSWGPSMGDIATFIANIDGNVVGDLLIDTSQLANSQINANNQTNLTVNADVNNTINNNINLDALSGNATVSGNTTAGDATSGNAAAMANIVNMINSMIATDSSFLAFLNINGNLDGDILLPPGVLNAILANNGPGSNSAINLSNTTNLDADITENDTVNNNVTANATSGQAQVSGNTTAGDATTGDASTSVTILNLVGNDVVAKNALLVFVNVLGHWVGLIMDAPSGTTAAALGGGVINASNSLNADIDATTNNLINNNVNVNATSGDATVSGNTSAGDATTGDATATVNIANLINSHLLLSDWFGILFINVFGTWNGSFGVNTAAGNPRPQPTGSSSVAAATSGGMGSGVFQFVAKKTSGGSSSAASGQVQAAGQSQVTNPAANNPANSVTPNSNPAKSGSRWVMTAAALLIGIVLIGWDRIRALFLRRKSN